MGLKICIYRGTHQIGGIASEISTEKTRILIDMGDELSVDPDFVPAPLDIPGVTDTNGRCDAVLFTHYWRNYASLCVGGLYLFTHIRH